MNNEQLIAEIVNRGYTGEGASLGTAISALLPNVQGIAPNWRNWGDARKLVAAKQAICTLYFAEKGISVSVGRIDGLPGMLTKNALETYDRVQAGGEANNRPKPTKLDVDSRYVINYERRNALPKQSEMMSYYGNVGSNQVEIRLPYRFRLDWDRKSTVGTMTCHKLAADDFSAIFETILAQYGMQNIVDLGLDLWGGTLAVRKMRNGTAWSMHAWGSAIDFHPDGNDLHTKWEDAVFSRDEYVPFINAFLGMGWISLGLEHNMDAMHFQRARIK